MAYIKHSLLKDAALWIYWYPFKYIIQALPAKYVYVIGKRLGAIASALIKQKRLYIEKELGRLFNGKLKQAQINDIIKKTFITHFQNELEVLLYPKLKSANISNYVKIEGLDIIARALESKKGVMLLISHFGANQMVMPALGYNGYKINQLSASALVWKEKMPTMKNRKMAELSLKIRWQHESSLPAKHIDIFGSIKEAFLCLKRNEILCVAIDGAGGDKRIEAEFLGKTAVFSTGAIDIALRTNCVVVPAFMVRQDNGVNTMIIHNPIELTKTQNKDDNIRENTQRFVKILEEYVNGYPHHYLNFLALRKMMEDTCNDTPFIVNL
ncbi:lipid A biosynthesis acyltransferase [Candidatus Magnetoovum chiemensis]|nr:lipid A biosynthesis acyltransferase [Candidatus Magnetoovum chiemensis]